MQGPLPVDVRRSKKPSFKLPRTLVVNGAYFQSIKKKHLVKYIHGDWQAVNLDRTFTGEFIAIKWSQKEREYLENYNYTATILLNGICDYKECLTLRTETSCSRKIYNAGFTSNRLRNESL